MLSGIYRFGHWLMSRWWMVWLLLIALTIGLGAEGFKEISPGERNRKLPSADSFYKAISLLAIQTVAVSAEGNGKLEAARWCGMVFWASAVFAVIVRLSGDSALRMLVKLFAGKHVIIAGLGQNGWRLIAALRKKGRSVVVVEPNREHPALELCRREGAIVLFGEPDDGKTLKAAKLRSASEMLALFADEEGGVRAITTANEILRDETATKKKPAVRCVLRLTEPGLLDVVRRHAIKTNPTDRIDLEILNAHEIAATTMVREATANSEHGFIHKALVLGLGTHHRLGEMVVLRLVKDHLINGDGRAQPRLQIDVFDNEAAHWLKSLLSRHPSLAEVCEITPHPCWARKVGLSSHKHDHDAAFVCIPDEGHATAQAVMLRRELLPETKPIMVRVLHSRSGFGTLIGHEKSGWGENIHPVGLEDPLFDPDMASRPEIEMRARTIHHEYRLVKRREVQANVPEANQTAVSPGADRPWHLLDASDRDQNRRLAEKYDEYLDTVVDPGKPNRYRRVFAPIRLGVGDLGTGITPAELDALAEREHVRWLAMKREQGFTFGEDRTKNQNPFLTEWSGLSDDQKAYAGIFTRHMPRILALADYAVEPLASEVTPSAKG